MLLNNGTWFGRLRATGGMGAIPSALLRNTDLARLRENSVFSGQDVSIPKGYTQASRASVPSFKNTGKIAIRMVGEQTAAFPVFGVGRMSVTMQGEGSTTFTGQRGATIGVTLQGSGSMTVQARGIGSMSIQMDAGARPSAFDIAQEIWQSNAASYNAAGTMGQKLNGAGSAGNPWTEVIESGLTAAEVMRIIAAAMAGKVSGAGTGTETFKGLDGTTNRIVSTVDNDGNRTAVTVNGA